MSAERERVAGFGRLEDGLLQAGDWYRWGPYVSERQWGTVREDYSADDPAWHDNLIFGEYFHGDNGAALGAFHQTGWTGLIGDVILRRHGAAPSIADVLSDLSRKAG